MPKRLDWDAVGERTYETGVDRGVLFVQKADGTYDNGVVWNGLTEVSESPEGAEPTSLYADNIKYLTLYSAEEFGFSITAYSAPEEFEACDGTAEVAPGVYIGQQNRSSFGFCYRTKVGNDTAKDEFGYKLHIYYGCFASPSERTNGTISDSPEAMELSWDVDCTPVNVPGFKPTASITINSTKITEEGMKKIEDILYGSDSAESRLPSPTEIIELLKTNTASVAG